jgi:hypothetical protein
MGSSMNFQTILSRVTLPATLERANKWLLTIVMVKMSLQIAECYEGLFAI